MTQIRVENTPMKTKWMVLLSLCLIAPSAAAQQPDELQEPRPIDAVASLWLEELTWMEIRDAINDGKTTVLVLTGGVESNGPHLASGKHNYSNKLMGESVARALGQTLIAPLVTLEPGDPSAPVTVGETGPKVSEETYVAWLTDIGDSLRGMGFTEVYFLGDSGGNRSGMDAAVDALTAKYQGNPTSFHHVTDFYNHDRVRAYLQETLGIPEQIDYTASRGSDGIHEELSIAAIMSVIDPTSIRYAQRIAAGRATINGISLEPLSETQALGRKVIEFRTDITVEAIEAIRAGTQD